MSGHSAKSARDEQITDRVHETSWSANLETPRHADSVERVLEDAVVAVKHTAPGTHVNLVTHGEHGNPSAYLYDRLESAFGARDIEWRYVDRCGCGGHVTRVTVGTDVER